MVAIIAGASALIGAFIPTLFSYLNTSKQHELVLQRELLEKQKDIYWDYMLALQEIINEQSDSNFLKLQKEILKMSIYADNATSLTVKSYWEALVMSSQEKRTLLSKEEHASYQKKILNSMRKNINLDTFEVFEIVGFRPPKK